MNPVCTITVEGNRAVAVGTISVGEKIDVTVVGIKPASIPDYGEESWFGGKSLRLRVVDTQGHDLARFPLKESDSWVVEGDRLSAVNVELNTRQLRNVFSGVAYGDKLQFGLILDSGIDHAQYARGKVNVQQWAVASIDDPTVVPDWAEVLAQLDRDLAEIETSKREAVNAAKESVDAAGVSGRNALAAEASALDAVASRNGAVAAKEAAVLASSYYPRIENGRWLVWQNGGWVDNGPAQGPKGDMPSLDGVVKKEDVVPVDIPGGMKIATIGNKKIMAPKGGGGGTPDDYATVRQNAAKGAAHASESGNPHGTTAAQIKMSDGLDVENVLSAADQRASAAIDGVEAHTVDRQNPHATTAEQVGAYTKGEVDEKISQNAAHYLTAKVGGVFVQFATHAALAAAKAAHTDENPQFWYGDDPHTPDKNDYLTVLDDEMHGHATTRYMFVGEWPDGFFRYQYTVNETALTQAQWNAVNSGITASGLAEIRQKLTNVDDIDDKRDKDDNICAVDGYGDFTFSDGIYRKLYKSTEVEHSFSTDGNWTGNEQPAEGVYYLTFYPENKTLYLQQDGGGHPVCTVERTKVAASGESYATTAGVRNIVSSDTETRTAISLLAEAAAKYKLVTVVADGNLTDRAINATSAASVTVPDDYTDLLIRASVTGSLSVTVPDGVTKYGDAFPAESGEYLVTITKLATGEAFVKTLKLEVANA